MINRLGEKTTNMSNACANIDQRIAIFNAAFDENVNDDDMLRIATVAEELRHELIRADMQVYVASEKADLLDMRLREKHL